MLRANWNKEVYLKEATKAATRFASYP